MTLTAVVANIMSATYINTTSSLTAAAVAAALDTDDSHLYTLPSFMSIDEFCEAIGFDIKNNEYHSFFWQAHKTNTITITTDNQYYRLTRKNEKIILKSHKLNYTATKSRCYTMDMDSFRALIKIYDKSSCNLPSLFAKFDTIVRKYHRYLNYNQNKDLIISQLGQHFERLSLELINNKRHVQALSNKMETLITHLQSQPVTPPSPSSSSSTVTQCIGLFKIDATRWRLVHRPFSLFPLAITDLYDKFPSAELLKTWQINKEYYSTVVMLMTIFSNSRLPYEYVYTFDECSLPANSDIIKLIDQHFS